MKRTLLGTLVLALAAAAMTPAAGQDEADQPVDPEAGDISGGERLVVTSDYVGPTVGGEIPDFTDRGAVVFTVRDDGPSEVLWATSEEALEEGRAARWVGDLTSSAQAAAGDYAAMGAVACVVWADKPRYDEEYDGMVASAGQSCVGNWNRQRVKGWLKYLWGWVFWRTADSDDSGWTLHENPIEVRLAKRCRDSDDTSWKTQARGTAELLSGKREIETVYSPQADVACGP